MELKKSYKGFLIWMLGFLVCCFGVIFLPLEDVNLIIRVVMNIMTISMAIIAYMIYRNGYVYWYTGITYEEAAAVSPERRKEYARKHLRLFGIYAVVYLVASVVLQVLQVSFWVDLVFGTLGLVVAAVRTVWYKL